MYTFIGEGAQKPPQINVTVPQGTMIFHVLNACKPVFVNDIAQFSGNGPDIQVRGRLSLASLPTAFILVRVKAVDRYAPVWIISRQLNS